MTKETRMQKYHGDMHEDSLENNDLLVEDDTLQSEQEIVRPVSKSKLEKYNTFLNLVIIISSILLVGIFTAMFFF